MSRRKRRADKRVHSKHLHDVLLRLIESPHWKDTLLTLEPPRQVAIDTQAVCGQVDAAARLVHRYQLSYILTVDVNNESGDPYPVEGAKVFKLQALRYPTVYGYAEELPECIGVGDGAA